MILNWDLDVLVRAAFTAWSMYGGFLRLSKPAANIQKKKILSIFFSQM